MRVRLHAMARVYKVPIHTDDARTVERVMRRYRAFYRTLRTFTHKPLASIQAFQVTETSRNVLQQHAVITEWRSL